MEILVINITNWIGYHITNRLLEEGYEVKGLMTEEAGGHLLHFFKRNSNFQLLENPGDEFYETVICVGRFPEYPVEIGRLILINSRKAPPGITDTLTIQSPYLFGEWMPMNADGYYEKERWLAFNSTDFKENGLYIDDFLQPLISWLKQNPSTDDIQIRSARAKKREKLEKFFFVKENKPIEDNVQQVLSHYERFKDLYPSID